MINIRPVSDLRNKYPEVEEQVLRSNEPVFLTKNGYGSMVVLSIEKYSQLIDNTEAKLSEADRAAEADGTRLSFENVLQKASRRIPKSEAV